MYGYSNETDIIENTHNLQYIASNDAKDNTKARIPIWSVTVNIELLYVHVIPEVVKFRVDSGGIPRAPLLNFLRDINNIAHRLYLGLSHIGGKLSSTSVVDRYTEIKKDGHIFRAHPCYLNKGC